MFNAWALNARNRIPWCQRSVQQLCFISFLLLYFNLFTLSEVIWGMIYFLIALILVFQSWKCKYSMWYLILDPWWESIAASTNRFSISVLMRSNIFISRFAPKEWWGHYTIESNYARGWPFSSWSIRNITKQLASNFPTPSYVICIAFR